MLKPDKKLSGLQRVLKIYGEITITSKDGKKVNWVWDYNKDEARIKDEMTREELMESDKAKYQDFQKFMLEISNKSLTEIKSF